ncbi:lytic transglycosylase domain-containing protein [Streptomyces sp. ISL-98]|uniref:lytic transglycosylase domain-containing protein n=1 Tax=Streptomyces sp. ISL-98 TaxID=2819192 RepID=UPI0020353422|nr:lytic murein transglycosylase [Streptomyces sp. ISL-98]
MAALTASQPPSSVARATSAAEKVTGQADQGISGDAFYYTELPPLGTEPPPLAVRDKAGPAARPGGGAVPATVLDAYRKSEAALAQSTPLCGLRWQLLAAIGQVESAQARGGAVDAGGTTYSPIIGPQLNGRGFATIRDTDSGAYDGDSSYDHAVGPMQFIPSTWAMWGADGNGDGSADPHNVYDAALAAGHYLCAGGRDLAEPYDFDRAVLSYNRSREYLRIVTSWFAYFTDGHREVPDKKGRTGPRAEPDSPSTRRKEPDSPRPRTGASPSLRPTPAPTPSSMPKPTPSPTRDRPSSGPTSEAPAVTLPGTVVELPDDGVLPGAEPGAGPLTSNG